MPIQGDPQDAAGLPDEALLAGPADGEAEYMRQLEARCEALIQREPAALAALAAAAPVERLALPRSRQLLRYYRGLGAGLQDEFAAALAEFAALLAEPELDDAVHARALNSGALFAQVLGRDEQALAWYRRSLAIWRRLGNGEREGLALLNMGILQYELHQYAEAEANVRASLERFTSAGAVAREAMAYNELGLLCRDQGRWDEAIAHLERAAAGFERQGADDYRGRVWNNLGEVAMLCGRYDEALRRFTGALELMATRVYQVDVHVNIGLVRQAQGDEAGALQAYGAARALAETIGRADSLPLILYRIGHAEQRLGRAEAALRCYGQAIEAIEARRAPLRDEGLLIGLMGRWQLIYEAAISLCLERGDPGAAFGYAERARARAFADMLARRHELSAPPVAPVGAAEAAARLPAGDLLIAFFAAGLPGPEAALLRAIPEAAAGLRSCLAAEPRLVRFTISRAQVTADICAINPQSLQPTTRFQADGRRFLPAPILRRLAGALLTSLAGPIAAAERVVLVPHGPLHQLPFAALPDSAGRPLLDQRPALVLAPSATLLLRAPRGPAPAPPRLCLALGYNGDGSRGLRHPEAEAAAVAALCGGDHWPPQAERLGRLAREAAGYRWLHLACHGEFNLEDPLASWLDLGPGERLSAAAILRDLRLNAELVTLSACRSGLSRVLRGDEPLGLVRALLAAGARAVLATLWEVEDRSARLLMERLYGGLMAGAAPAAALATAQQWLRAFEEGGARPYADPRYWAAYTLVIAG
jgi:tetratricopeptide (TPR) repeat protein